MISPRGWFDDYYYADFEDFQIRLPIGIDDYLKQVYGDYMIPPSSDLIEARHSFYYLNLEERISFEDAKKQMTV